MENYLRLVRPEIRGEKPYLVGAVADDSCKLNQNECPFDVPSEMKRMLLETFEKVPFNRYPTEQPFQLMARIEAHYNLPPGSVLVGNGSNDLTQTLGLCFISNGVRVALPRPMFALFESVVRMHSGEVVPIAPLPNLQFDMDAVISAASSEEVALTIVASPNNPTGLAVRFQDLKQLCEEASGIVVIDEAYQEFNLEPSAVSLLDQHPNVLVMRTLSKAFGLAGLRIGYLLGHPGLLGEILKARLPFMIDRFSEHTAMCLLDHPEIISDRVEQGRQGVESLTRDLSGIDGVTVLPSTTNFVLFRSADDPGVVASGLSEQGVIVRSMAGYPELKPYLRVTSGTDAENKVFVAALKRVLTDSV